MVGAALLLVASAFAWETDNLTNREVPLEEATPALDDKVDEVLALAIEATNNQLSCNGDPERTQHALAKQIRIRMSNNEMVPDHKGIKALGYDHYAAWIEKGGAPHREFLDRRDVFGDVKLMESPILKWAGVCGEVRIGPWLVGVDKLDHFFEEGYESWKRSDYGETPADAIEWATKTELTIYGLETSQTFSYGDLAADHAGMQFYDGLLDPDYGVARIDEKGCVEKSHAFSWNDHVTWEFDEVMNPPVYSAKAQAAVTRHLEEHRDGYCASYAAWGGPEYLSHLGRVLDVGNPDYVSADAPKRTDPYRLEQLCSGWAGSIVTDTNSLGDTAEP